MENYPRAFHRRSLLLTGGAGFIGSHLAEALLQQRADVSIVDNFDPCYSAALKEENLNEIQKVGQPKVFRSSINDYKELQKIFEQMRPEIVVHFAALPGVRQSLDHPKRYHDVNVGGTINLLELSRKFAVKKFLLASSSSVYGRSARLPFSEDECALHPISFYGATKLAAEMWASMYARFSTMQVVCLRLFSAYGPRQRPDLVISQFVSAIEARRKLQVFGNGESERDYTFISDIISGIVAALNFDTEKQTGTKFELFNLGSSAATSLSRLVGLLSSVTGREVTVDHEALRSGDLPFTRADIGKARRLLGYHPMVSLETGIKRFISWYRAHPAAPGM